MVLFITQNSKPSTTSNDSSGGKDEKMDMEKNEAEPKKTSNVLLKVSKKTSSHFREAPYKIEKGN